MNAHDNEFLPHRPWYVRWFWPLYAISFAILIAAGLWQVANAQTPQDFKVCSDTACVQVIVTPVALPCPPKPADQTQPGVCPAGTTGSWTQTQTYTSAAAPTCWTPSGYLPIAAPAGACVATPPPTPNAPVNLTATVAANAANPVNSNVTLAWTAVTGVAEYEVWRCTGASCTNFVFLADATAATYTNTNLPPGLTYRYKVRGWKPVIGPYSTIVNVATTTASPPVATGAATLNWTHDGKNTDGSTVTLTGFRVLYGPAATDLTQTVQVTNPALRTYVIDKLAVGTWFFAVRAVSAGGESASSNVATKSVQ